MPVRLACEQELETVNQLRRQVHELHAKGKPEVFKQGFPDELREHIYDIWRDPMQDIAVCERAGEIVGFAVLHHIVRPETPFMYVRDYIDVDEFGVDEAHRRRGVATELVEFNKDYARGKGMQKVELNMWEFNSSALAFYEEAGFTTYRRYMELLI